MDNYYAEYMQRVEVKAGDVYRDDELKRVCIRFRGQGFYCLARWQNGLVNSIRDALKQGYPVYRVGTGELRINIPSKSGEIRRLQFVSEYAGLVGDIGQKGMRPTISRARAKAKADSRGKEYQPVHPVEYDESKVHFDYDPAVAAKAADEDWQAKRVGSMLRRQKIAESIQHPVAMAWYMDGMQSGNAEMQRAGENWSDVKDTWVEEERDDFRPKGSKGREFGEPAAVMEARAFETALASFEAFCKKR